MKPDIWYRYGIYQMKFISKHLKGHFLKLCPGGQLGPPWVTKKCNEKWSLSRASSWRSVGTPMSDEKSVTKNDRFLRLCPGGQLGLLWVTKKCNEKWSLSQALSWRSVGTPPGPHEWRKRVMKNDHFLKLCPAGQLGLLTILTTFANLDQCTILLSQCKWFS